MKYSIYICIFLLGLFVGWGLAMIAVIYVNLANATEMTASVPVNDCNSCLAECKNICK